MNLTVQQYLTGFERSVANLPGLLQRWHELDEDLREHLADELWWMADVHDKIVMRARREGREDLAHRLLRAGFQLLEQRELIEQQVGLSLRLKHEIYSNMGGRFATMSVSDQSFPFAAMNFFVPAVSPSVGKPANDDGYVAALAPSLAYAA